MNDHEFWMKKAIELAKEALAQGEFPVGCVIVKDGKIVAEGRRTNSKGKNTNELDHAEIMALRQISSNDRQGLIAYSTLEPCLMCLGALVISGVEKIVYSYEDAFGGACSMNITNTPPLYKNIKARIIGGVLRDKSLKLFKQFFKNPKNNYLKNTPLEHYTLCQSQGMKITR